MNVAELKVDLVQLIMAIDEESTLQSMFKAIKELAQKDDWRDEMSPEQQASLTKSLAETEDPKKWIAHEDVIKMSRQWLSE